MRPDAHDRAGSTAPPVPTVSHVPHLLNTWTARELAQQTFSSTFLIEPILPTSGIMLFYGKRGIGKSHFAMTLSACLAHSGRLFGRYSTRAVPIAYVQADMAPELQQERVRRALQCYSLPALRFYFTDFLSVPDLTPTSPVVRQILREEPGIIIWDTLRNIHRMDENSNETPAWVYGTARHCFPGAAHLFIHHDRKTKDEQFRLDPDESFSGAGAWLNAADVGCHLLKMGPGRLQLFFTKIRAGPEQAPLPLTLDPVVLLLYASTAEAAQLADSWWKEHRDSNSSDLERFLLNSFACSRRAARILAYRVAKDGGGV